MTVPQKERENQESKPSADVGWLLEFGKPDVFIPKYGGGLYLVYGDMVVDMDNVTDALTYQTFKERKQANG